MQPKLPKGSQTLGARSARLPDQICPGKFGWTGLVYFTILNFPGKVRFPVLVLNMVDFFLLCLPPVNLTNDPVNSKAVSDHSSTPKNTHMHQHATNNNIAGIFGPLTCSFLFASALQEPGSESRLFWFQSWKIIDKPSFVLRHT